MSGFDLGAVTAPWLSLMVAGVLGSAPAAATESIVLGMGCFWGAEQRLAAQPGVIATTVGYAGGSRPDPTYRQVLEDEGRPGIRNHAEVVQVVFDPRQTSLERILAAFWENHDPTQLNRQGHDIGSNYRSAIYYQDDRQRLVAERSRARYQAALSAAGYGRIVTEIAPLERFYPAEEYHQKYLRKHPDGYCGLGGTGVAFPAESSRTVTAAPLDPSTLAHTQLIVFAAEHCPACARFRADIADHWRAPTPLVITAASQSPAGWHLTEPLWATPTVVLFRDGRELSRYTGYQGDRADFWRWLGQAILTPEQQRIAYAQGTERAFTGSLLDNKTPGTYVDPITGAPLFRSEAKFDSGSGWPSFVQPLPEALTFHEDHSHGLRRIEVRSASSGIHLGHVFDDGPPPTGQRYCINSAVLHFIPDPPRE